MATITITIPDAVVNRVLDAFAATYGWDTNSGETKSQFAKRQVIEFAMGTVRRYEADTAVNTAHATATATADTEIVIT